MTNIDLMRITMDDMRGLLESASAKRNDFTPDEVINFLGVDLAVKGEYEPADKSVGWEASYNVQRVWIESDLEATNLKELLECGLLLRDLESALVQQIERG